MRQQRERKIVCIDCSLHVALTTVAANGSYFYMQFSHYSPPELCFTNVCYEVQVVKSLQPLQQSIDVDYCRTSKRRVCGGSDTFVNIYSKTAFTIKKTSDKRTSERAVKNERQLRVCLFELRLRRIHVTNVRAIDVAGVSRIIVTAVCS